MINLLIGIISLMLVIIMFYINGKAYLKLFSFFNVRKKLYWFIYVFSHISILFLVAVPNKHIQLTAYFYMGFFVYYCMFNIVCLIIELLPIKVFREKLFTRIMEPLKIVLVIILIIYGNINFKNIVLTEYTIMTDKITKDMNIVVIADIHLGKQIGSTQIRYIVERINNLNPDMVLIVGDTFDLDVSNVRDLDKVVYELKKLETVYGTFAVLGNHDLYRNNLELNTFFLDSDITLLEDEIYEFNNITIIGRKDVQPIDRLNWSRKEISELMVDIDPNRFVIVMDHQGDGQRDAIRNNVDLLLNGHTHNGQIFPGNLIVELINKVGYGHRRFENTDIVVTSGVSYWGPPIRIGTVSEIVLIRLIAG